MSKFARTIRIGAPLEAVWTTLADVEAWPAWASQFKRLERLEAGPLALGSRVRVRPRGLPGAVWQVTEYEAGRSFTWAARLLPGLQVIGGHVVSPDGEATLAEFSLEAGGTLAALLSPLLRRTIFSRNTKSATEGLKRHLEARRPATT
jgi:ligand-binding SRPBCC domain-containing protein